MKIHISIFLMAVAMTANAATFCINDSAELVAALDTARNNGEADEIRIRSGDYLTPNITGFLFNNAENHNLSISGGWTPFNQFDCFSQLAGPLDTTLDGDDFSPVLYIVSGSGTPEISISNLTITKGITQAQNIGAGITFYNYDDFDGQFLLDQVFFFENEGPIGAALSYTGSGTITVRNSVFLFNNNYDGKGVVNVSLSPDTTGFYFINNTMIFNSSDLGDTSTSNVAGLHLNMFQDQNNIPQAMIANNLFWYQSASDFYVTFSGGLTYLYNNNYYLGAGLIEDQANNISEQPLLASPLFDFTPQAGSPLINAGLSMDDPLPVSSPFLENWDHGTEDFDRGIWVRVVNRRVDIGAVEAPPEVPIFKDGFDQ